MEDGKAILVGCCSSDINESIDRICRACEIGSLERENIIQLVSGLESNCRADQLEALFQALSEVYDHEIPGFVLAENNHEIIGDNIHLLFKSYMVEPPVLNFPPGKPSKLRRPGQKNNRWKLR